MALVDVTGMTNPSCSTLEGDIPNSEGVLSARDLFEGTSMRSDDDDLPVSYLWYAFGLILAIGVGVCGFGYFLLR